MGFSSLGERVSVGVKAHVLYNRLLTREEYWSLLSSQTVAEVADKLRSMSYSESLSTLSMDPHRFEIEESVRTSLVSQAENLLGHFGESRKKFFRAWYSWYEAENMKSIFRYIAAGRTERDDLRRRLYPIMMSHISFENMLVAKDFAEVVELFRGTSFYRVLSEPLRRLSSGEETSLFPLEMALDGYVELSLFRAMNKLAPDERKMLLPIFGTRIDLFNLYILYRALVFYDLTPEEILNRLLPVRYRISLQILRECVRFKTFSDVASAIEERFPAYVDLFDDASRDDEPQLALERNIKRYIYIQCQKVFRSGSPAFHTAMSYFILKEYEISDITHVVEGVRYGYDRRKSAAYLIAPVISGGEPEWQY
ncbi:MAG: V-type ATPase subunit [Synergistaceae bacterium]|nr:V-type ATPase subunit [Synergistaceae bacterium]